MKLAIVWVCALALLVCAMVFLSRPHHMLAGSVALVGGLGLGVAFERMRRAS
jgi:Na+/glutamate symporter